MYDLRTPICSDGIALSKLIRRCKPLDENSLYLSLLQCSHFADTAVLAFDSKGELLASVTAYIKPGKPDTLFIWQVAVDQRARGQGLALKLLLKLLALPACIHITQIETTITDDNQASQNLFSSLSSRIGASITKVRNFFDGKSHFGGQHASEDLYVIGPISQVKLAELNL